MSRKRNAAHVDPDLPAHLMSKPKINKIDHMNVVINGLEIGHSSMQGYRVSMEDAFIIDSLDSIEQHTVVAILDGHAGDGCSTISSTIFCDMLEATPQWSEYVATGAITPTDSPSARDLKLTKLKMALVQAFCDLDQHLRDSEWMDASGSTLVMALITPTHIVCANVGDSRCVIGSGGKGVLKALS